ncbi:MAG: hypothetical protein WC986_13725 [Elusimicrobiota bacterium]|jgi:hypothetical protein
MSPERLPVKTCWCGRQYRTARAACPVCLHAAQREIEDQQTREQLRKKEKEKTVTTTTPAKLAETAPAAVSAPARTDEPSGRVCASPPCGRSLDGMDSRRRYCSERCSQREVDRRKGERLAQLREIAASVQERAVEAPPARAALPVSTPELDETPVEVAAPVALPVPPSAPAPTDLEETLHQVAQIILDQHEAMALIPDVSIVTVAVTVDRAGRVTLAAPSWR